MKKMVITKNGIAVETQRGSEQELTAWFQKVKNAGVWGKPERWVSEDRIQIEGENINNSIETIVEPILGRDVTLYKFAAEYTVATTDITAEILATAKTQLRLKKRSFGEGMIDKISSINDSKQLTTEQVDAFMGNSLISSLREHLWAGNIDTFVSIRFLLFSRKSCSNRRM
jgi:hypothetical protein